MQSAKYWKGVALASAKARRELADGVYRKNLEQNKEQANAAIERAASMGSETCMFYLSNPPVVYEECLAMRTDLGNWLAEYGFEVLFSATDAATLSISWA